MDFPNIFVPIIMIPTRYFIVAGIFYLIFYKIFRNKFIYLRIQNRFPKPKTILTEIIFSIQTMIIFALVVILIRYLVINKYSMIYREISDFGLIYFVFSIIILILLHDFYFYFSHKLIHHKKLFFIHKRHHLSTNPTPWSAFSFGPIEAIIQIIWLPIIILIIPLHPLSLLVWALWMMIMNVIGHLGFEIFSKNFLNSFIGKILLSSTHHNIHHSRSKSNFGLYFTFWDRIMKTEDEDYKKTYEHIKNKINTKVKFKPQYEN